MKRKLLVIVVTYNAMKWIDKCFTTVLTSSCNPDLYVIDNGSTDGTINYIKEHYPNIIFIESKNNLGFGKANNEGFRYALQRDYDYVYLLNQDAWIFQDTLEKLMDVFEKNSDYGVISPIQCQANLRHLDRNFQFNIFGVKSSSEFLNDLYFNNMKEVYEIPFVMAAHWMISRECLLKVGGFSNTFPHYGEDCNYIHRLRYHKFNVGIAPNINVVHDREYRMESLEKQLYMVYIYNLIYLSDIRYSIWVRHITAIKYTLREVVRLKSIFPICEYFKSLSRMYFINFNNKLSKKIGSTFIN